VTALSLSRRTGKDVQSPQFRLPGVRGDPTAITEPILNSVGLKLRRGGTCRNRSAELRRPITHFIRVELHSCDDTVLQLALRSVIESKESSPDADTVTTIRLLQVYVA
jgi:hypothetical protein